MPARLIDGAAHARAIRADLKSAVERLGPGRRRPGITVIQVGEDPASAVYVKSKHRAAVEAGFSSAIQNLPATTSQAQLERAIISLAADSNVDGILLQMPLPVGLDSDAALEAIPPDKDVDGLHPYNAGRLAQGLPTFVPATPLGIYELLVREGVETAGQHAVIIGRSRLVGRPLAMLLLLHDATVTVCHSKTRDMRAISRSADILVAATGKPGLVTGEHVRPGAIVIDVGIARDPASNKLRGDVDRRSVEAVASMLTPVPGGVGPMTIAMVLANTLRAFRSHTLESH